MGRRLQIGGRSRRRTKTPERKLWFASMIIGGRRAAIDWNLHHSKVIEYPGRYSTYKQTAGGRFGVPSHHGQDDKAKYDRPRKDIAKFKDKGGMNAYAGHANKKTRQKATVLLKKIMKTNFTAREQREMGTIILDVSGKAPGVGSALAMGVVKDGKGNRRARASYVTIHPKALGGANEDEILVHELVHARRSGSGQRFTDRDHSELKTELETFGRLTLPQFKHALRSKQDVGYYVHVPSIRKIMREDSVKHGGSTKKWNLIAKLQRQAKVHDRKLLTGDLRKGKKGKAFVRRVNSQYSLSRIAEGDPRRRSSNPIQGKAENRDRYFGIKLKGKREMSWHVYDPQGTTTLRSIRTYLKGQHGPDVTVYEYHDGEKKQILGPKKRKTKKKITTKKKRKAPRRKAKRRNN